MADRLRMLERWLREDLRLPLRSIAPASADASFRRYFRVTGPFGSRIVMDAPPEKEDCGPYLAVAGMLLEIGVNVPEVIEADRERGFLLLTDLGSRPYLGALDEATVERLYGDALAALMLMQKFAPADERLPDYDRARLHAEMSLFPEWYVERHRGVRLDDGARRTLEEAFRALEDAALEQPRVFVHRDYHARNLMVVPGHNPGILDFQDAVVGPITYDLVSLLRDCYIAWPRARVESWALGYRERARQAGLIGEVDVADFLRWFDWMGVQRHLKASGIFARLNHRDGKPGYLADIPRTLAYVSDVCARYDALAGLGRLVRELAEPVARRA